MPNNYDDIISQMKADQSATGTGPANPYDGAVSALKYQSQNDQARAALAISLQSNESADVAARNAQLAKRYNTSPEVVAAYPQEFKDRMALEMARDTLANAPKLQAHINDNPQVGAVIHDDINNAAAIERASQPQQYMTAWEGPEQGQTVRERISNYWRGIFGAPTVEEERRAKREAEATAILVGRKGNPNLTDDEAFETSRKAIGGMSPAAQIAAERFIDSATFGLVAPTDPTKARSWQQSVSGGVGQLAGFMAGPGKVANAMINPLEHAAGESFIKGLSKSVVNEAATLALATALEKSGHAALDSHSTDEASKIMADALGSGAEMGATFGAFKKVFPDNTVAQWLGRAVGVSAAQDISEGTNPLDDRVPLEDRVFKYLMNTAFTMHGGGRSTGGWLRDMAESKVAEQDFGQISTLGQLSAASEWRKRDPDGFKEYVRRVTEDGHLENVYVDAQTFAQTLIKNNVGLDELMQKVPAIAEQMQEGLETQGLIRIPTDDYATHIAGSKIDPELLQHLKTDPDGKTYAEAQTFYQTQAEQMKETAATMVKEGAAQTAFRESSQRVQDQIQDQLTGGGLHTTEQAKTTAAIQAGIIARVAAREGITPEQAWEKYSTVLSKTALGERGFDQDLLIQHNLSAENLLHAVKMGGIPVPSLAVTKKQSPLTNFGEITLLGDRGLANPRGSGGKTKVFGADIYSPRYPQVSFRLDKKAVKSLNDELASHRQEGDREIYSSDIDRVDDLTSNKVFRRYAEAKIGEDANRWGKTKQLAQELLTKVGATEHIFKGYDYNGNRRYVAHTIENVAKILKKELRGGEGFNYGVGNLRAKLTPEFKSIEQIQKNKDRLMSAEDFEAVKKEVDDQLLNLSRDLNLSLDQTLEVIEDAPKMGAIKAIERAFEDYGDGGSPSTQQVKDVAEYLTKLRNLPTAYFEAKILRNVGLDEFRAAVVPEGVDPKVIEALNERGITDIRTYKDEADRAAKIGSFDELFFQTSPEQKPLAPNGKPSNLHPQLHAMVRTPEFKNWFGDWEKFATMQGGVWNDANGEVSKVVDENGEPLVVYHGTDTGGFHTFNEPTGDKRGDLGIFLTPNREMAQTYVKRGPGKDFSKEQLTDDGEKLSGVYPLFANIRNPLETDFEGAHWSGERTEQWELFDDTGEKLYAPNGKGYFTEKELDLELERLNSLDVSAKAEPAAEHYETTDSVAKEARRDGNDGAAIRNVVDAGSGGGSYIDEASDVFIAFKPEQLKSIENIGAFSPEDANILKQETRGGYSPADRSIALLKNADLSTYLHETGHWALDIYSKIAASPEASPEIRGDMEKVLKWFGVESLEKWNSMSIDEQRPHHEQFARGFEAYLMEGKAPSQELQPFFQRIRGWMMNIYQSLKNLNVELSPEVRGVFDRMLASEEAIADAQAARVFEPLFKEKPEGMTDQEWSDYQALGQAATNDAIDEMVARSVKDMKWASGAKSKALRELQKQAKATREKIRAEVEAEVDQQPIYQAERFLRTGETVDEKGNPVKSLDRKATKLNSEMVRKMYPEEMLGDSPDLERLKGMMGPKGLDPDMVADIFGFRSGDELVRNLADMEPRASVIEGLTEKRMIEEHSELTDPDKMNAAANEAIHNEARARFVATGLKVLAKSPIPARELLRGAREAAEAAIGAKRVRDVNPRQHEAAETKANKEALKLVAKEPAKAVQAQRASLLNNQLAKSAREALRDVEKGLAYFKKFDKPSVREGIQVEFREQIDQLLGRYDLRSSITPEQAFEKNMQSLEAFVEKLAAMKFNVDVPESMIVDANRMHYKDMPVEQFRGLVDAVKSLEKLGREVQKISDGNESRLLQDVALEAVAQTEKLPQREIDTNRGLTRIADKWIKTKSLGRSLAASLLKVEQMVDWLDDYNSNGVFNRLVFRKVAEAEGRRHDLDLKVSQAWEKHVEGLDHEILKNNRGTLEIPGVIDGLTGKTQRVTWNEKIALAGIRGDASHFSKLLKGEKWDPEAVLDFLDKNMTKAEWDFVKGLADTFQEIYPLKQEMLRSMGATAAKDVERIPFATQHGEYSGWYWPITYDPARSQSVKERHAKHENQLFEDNIYSRADTSTGREMTRNENYAKPMLLSIDVLPRILKDEIRDISMRKAIVEADRFLRHPDVRKAITGVLSPEHYDIFNGWLLSVANDAMVKPSELQMWDRVAHEIRTRTTMVGLGFRVSTMIMHGTTALGESVAEAGVGPMAKGIFNKKTWAGLMGAIGPEWMNKGLENFLRSDQFVANRDFIFERSAEMRHRSNELERDVREQLRTIEIKLMDPATGAIERGKLAVQARAYEGICMLDMASAMPTWMGAYLKGMSPEGKGGLGMSEEDAIYFADKTVRNAHGGGGVKDLAAVQRGGEWWKLFTMFYTFWNHNINRIADTAKRVKELPRTYSEAQESGNWAGFRGDVGTLILRSFMYTLGVQAVHHMMHPPKEGEEDEAWIKWFAKQMALSAFGGIPLARDVVGHYAGGKDYEMSPVAAIIDSTDRTLKDADNIENASRFIKHAMTTAGYLTGLPLGQPASTVQFLHDVWSGDQAPEDISEWWRGLTTGDMHKH